MTTHTIYIDTRRPEAQFAIRMTGYAATRVEIAIRDGAALADLEGYSVALWYGPSPEEGETAVGHSVSAVTITGSVALVDLAIADTSYEGRLLAQVMAQGASGELEILGTGTIWMLANPARDTAPMAFDDPPWATVEDISSTISASVADIPDLPESASLSQISGLLRALLAALKGTAVVAFFLSPLLLAAPVRFGDIPESAMIETNGVSVEVDAIARPIATNALAVAISASTNATNALAQAGTKVPLTRTINAKPLSANVILSASDVAAVPLIEGTGVAPAFQAGGGMLTGSSYLLPYALVIGDGHSDFAERIQIDDVGIKQQGFFSLLWPTNNFQSPIATIHDISEAVSGIAEEQDPLSLHTDGGTMAGPLSIGPENYIQLGTSSYVNVSDPDAIVGDSWFFRNPNVTDTDVFEFAAIADLGKFADIASNVVYHVVVSNGHWLVSEVQ